MWTVEISHEKPSGSSDIKATWTEEGEEPITYSGQIQNKSNLPDFACNANACRDTEKARRRRTSSLKKAAEDWLNG